MRLRTAGGFVAVALGVLGAIWAVKIIVPKLVLDGYHPAPIVPGRIDLIAVRREAGYRIIVSNGIAHLVEISANQGAFDAPDPDKQGTEDAPRLPIRETLQALQGNPEALGKMVMSVNKMKEEDLPPVQVVWTSADIQAALGGDPVLRSKLEHDLNTKLDGTPLDTVDLNAIMNGIVIENLVDVKVPYEGSTKTVTCRVREPYTTLFSSAVANQINQKFNVSEGMLIGIYREEANKLNGRSKEDVTASLRSKIDRRRNQQRAEGPERILSNTTVVVNENQMAGASYSTREGPNNSILADIDLRLTDEGRMRLWKYSHENPGFQLLLTMDGIAIAAPRITTELPGDQVKMTGVPSADLAEKAVEGITKAATTTRGR